MSHPLDDPDVRQHGRIRRHGRTALRSKLEAAIKQYEQSYERSQTINFSGLKLAVIDRTDLA
jgi:hypothetical protein